ncbi:MAG: hypothetical protein LBD07_01610 [Spirochaetaceae bacterium]|nr:hypothetical protein [Spirochaetaceae bacterium]
MRDKRQETRDKRQETRDIIYGLRVFVKRVAPLIIPLTLILFGSLLLLIYPVQSLLIAAGENFIVHRQLNAPVWHERFIRWSFTGIALNCIFYISLLLINIDKKFSGYYGRFFLLSFLICITSCLSPFGLKAMDPDTTVYLTIAQGITEGRVPFKDFYDNKGPLLYLISAPGFALGRFTGVWITELLFMFVSMIFAFKTALFFGKRKEAFAGVTLSFIIFQTFFYEVAGTEEYVLPFMTISLYIFTKYYFCAKKIVFSELVVLGFCFASAVFLRINFFSLWLGFCVCIFIETIINRDFKNLVKYTAGFLTGITLITAPVLIYLIGNNAFFDYIQQNFITGSSRGLSGFNIAEFIKSFFMITGKNFCFIPMLAAFVWIVKNKDDKKKGYYYAYLLAFILTVSFHAAIRSNFDHYNMVLTPFLVPAFTCFVQHIKAYFSNYKHRILYLTIFFLILLSPQLVKYYAAFINSVGNKSRMNHIIAGKIIDENTSKNDKIISLGFQCCIYLFTERRSASRYIYQISGVDYEPKAHEEFLNDLYHNKPAVIIIRLNYENLYDYLPAWYTPVYDLIERDYELLSDKYDFALFKKRRK